MRLRPSTRVGRRDRTRSAQRLGALLRAGDVVVLDGELGSGKTVFAKGIAVGLGITEPVVSPTFTIVREYDAPTAARARRRVPARSRAGAARPRVRRPARRRRGHRGRVGRPGRARCCPAIASRCASSRASGDDDRAVSHRRARASVGRAPRRVAALGRGRRAGRLMLLLALDTATAQVSVRDRRRRRGARRGAARGRPPPRRAARARDRLPAARARRATWASSPRSRWASAPGSSPGCGSASPRRR